MVQAGEGRLRAEPASQGGETLDTVLPQKRTEIIPDEVSLLDVARLAYI